MMTQAQGQGGGTPGAALRESVYWVVAGGLMDLQMDAVLGVPQRSFQDACSINVCFPSQHHRPLLIFPVFRSDMQLFSLQ
jgi:hypothetical protein